MIAASLFLALAGEPGEVDRFLPCTPGLEIEYAVTEKDGRKSSTVTERVRGPGTEARTCVLERKMLFADGKTDLLENFVSNKTRRKFKARLAYDKKEGKVSFEFEPRAAKAPAKKAVARKAA